MGMMINRRREMGGRNLPYDAEIEYLERSGTQYINTHYIPVRNTGVEVKYMPLTFIYPQSQGCCPLGARIAWQKANFLIYSPINNLTECYFCLGNTYTVFSRSNIINNIHTATLYQNKSYALFDDITYLVNGYGDFNYTSPFYLFALNNNGNVVTSQPVRIYYCKIYEDNDLQRDFIPVRVGNVGYMYDKVSGQLFGNAGTGAFILGPDK